MRVEHHDLRSIFIPCPDEQIPSRVRIAGLNPNWAPTLKETIISCVCFYLGHICPYPYVQYRFCLTWIDTGLRQTVFDNHIVFWNVCDPDHLAPIWYRQNIILSLFALHASAVGRGSISRSAVSRVFVSLHHMWTFNERTVFPPFLLLSTSTSAGFRRGGFPRYAQMSRHDESVSGRWKWSREIEQIEADKLLFWLIWRGT